MKCNVVYKDTLCCEPIIRKMPWGYLLVCECGGPCEPSIENKILAFISTNCLEWEGPYACWDAEGAQCLSELFVAPDGYAYGFFLCHSAGFIDSKTCFRRTLNGRSWEDYDAFSEMSDIIFLRGSVMLPDDKGVVIPYQKYFLNDCLRPDCRLWMPGVCNHVENGTLLYTWKDGVLQWSSQPAVTVFPSPVGVKFAFTESAIVWTGENTLKMLIRMDSSKVLYESLSIDKGDHWCAPVPTDIPNPGNKICLQKLPDGRIILLHTPNTEIRSPFELWISDDNMKTWQSRYTLLNDVGDLYHYADCIVDGDRLLITIERNRKEILLLQCSLSDFEKIGVIGERRM